MIQKTNNEKMRFHLLIEYNPAKGDVIIENEILQEDFRSFLLGLAGLLAPLTSTGQNALQRAEEVINKQQPITINGKAYDSPAEFQQLQTGIQTVKQFTTDADLQSFLKGGVENIENAPQEVVDFYKEQKVDPAVRQILNLASQMTKGSEYKTSSGSKVNVTGVNSKSVNADVSNVQEFLKQGYDITDVQYVETVNEIRQKSPDTTVMEFRLDNKDLFKENGYRLISQDMQQNQNSQASQMIDTLVKLSQQGLLTEIEIVGSASNIPTHVFGGSNQKLSEARACALADTLQKSGIPSDIISTQGVVQGPEWDPNVTKEDRIHNYHPFQNVTIRAYVVDAKINEPVPSTPTQKFTMGKLQPEKNIDKKNVKITGGKQTGKSKKISQKGKMRCPVLGGR